MTMINMLITFKNFDIILNLSIFENDFVAIYKIMSKILLLLILLYLTSLYLHSQDGKYVTYKAVSGDGITIVLNKFSLSVDKFNVDFFNETNKERIINGGLIAGKEYVLPISIINYNGKSLKQSIAVNDKNYINKIKKYNNRVVRKRLKLPYTKDLTIWIPLSLKQADIQEFSKQTSSKIEMPKISSVMVEPLFGERHKSVTISSNSLSGCIFYIISGHGGSDPGAVGYKDGNELHEDEYAYDVSLRLAKRLMEVGAEVYIIVQDPNDGIRDEKYLKNSYNEYHINNHAIPQSQNERLSSRVSIVNDLYAKNKSKKKQQYCIETHVDSRYTGKKVDIFFYYKDGNSEGRRMANTLMKTIKNKYNKAQPGRGYEGSVSSRGLYMIRKLQPTTIFIEIGNIQNPRDQIRIIESNNRQAIANWLTDGIINSITGN